LLVEDIPVTEKNVALTRDLAENRGLLLEEMLGVAKKVEMTGAKIEQKQSKPVILAALVEAVVTKE